jgi:Ser/Thr protein kinase RdoA (MazF antagonist)
VWEILAYRDDLVLLLDVEAAWFILRLIRSETAARLDQIRARLQFQVSLSGFGLTDAPVNTVNGDSMCFLDGDPPRAGVLWQFRPGESLEVLDRDACRRIGMLVASLAGACEHLQRHHEPWLRSMPWLPVCPTRGRIVLCHGDIHQGNIRISPECGMRLIDFWDCGWGPEDFDLSQMIVSLIAQFGIVDVAEVVDGYRHGMASFDIGRERAVLRRVHAGAMARAALGMSGLWRPWRDWLAETNQRGATTGFLQELLDGHRLGLPGEEVR